MSKWIFWLEHWYRRVHICEIDEKLILPFDKQLWDKIEFKEDKQDSLTEIESAHFKKEFKEELNFRY